MPNVSGSPTQIATSAATLVELSNTPVDQFRAGDMGYVAATRNTSTGPLFILVTDSPLPTVNGTTVLSVYQQPNMRWVALTVIGSGASSILYVANLTELAALTDAAMPDGQLVWVRTLQAFFNLSKTSGATADAITVVTALSGGAARWLRNLTNRGTTWRFQTQWYVDPAAGNDENTGATNVTALKTVAELSRRLQVLTQGTTYTCDLLGNIPSTDRFNWTPTFVDPSTGTGFNQRGVFTIRGQMTVSRSGTLTGATTQTTTSAQASAVDAGVADWTADIGNMIVVTGGAQTGETAWVAANLGGNTARVSSWTTAAGTGVGVVPVNGSTYNVVTLTTWSCEGTIDAAKDSMIFTFENIEMRSPGGNAVAFISSGAAFRPIRTKINSAANSSPPLICDSALFRSSCFAQVGTTALGPGSMQLTSGVSYVGTAGCMVLNLQVELLYGTQWRFSDTLYQGTRLQLANSGSAAAQGGYAILSGNSGFFDWDRNAAANGRDAAISVEGIGWVGITGFVFGSSAVANTYGVRVEAGGQLMVASQGGVAGISVAGAAAAIRFDDPGIGAATGTAIPPLTAGAAVPAVSPLTTWANWAAAPFNSYVMSYRNGARIYING